MSGLAVYEPVSLDVDGLLPPTHTPFTQLPLPLSLPLPEDVLALVPELEPELPLLLLLLVLGLAAQDAGQKHDGVQVELDFPLPWQVLPASVGTDGHLSTPSSRAIAIPPLK